MARMRTFIAVPLDKAIRDFRDDRLARFRAFAELCVTRQIITAVKTATRQKHVPLNGYGHAVLTPSGVAASARSGELVMRRLIDPAPVSVLCLITSAHKRPTPLSERTMRLLTALVHALPA